MKAVNISPYGGFGPVDGVIAGVQMKTHKYMDDSKSAETMPTTAIRGLARWPDALAMPSVIDVLSVFALP